MRLTVVVAPWVGAGLLAECSKQALDLGLDLVPGPLSSAGRDLAHRVPARAVRGHRRNGPLEANDRPARWTTKLSANRPFSPRALAARGEHTGDSRFTVRYSLP